MSLSCRRIFFGIAITLFALASQANAQNSSDRGTPADSKKGQSTQSTYARDKIETVNLANGNFSLSIPLATIGGRGSASFTIALSYNSKVWTTQSDRNGVYTENGAEGTPRNIYSAIHDNIQPEEDEPYLSKLGSGWSILTAPGIKIRMVGIDPQTLGCNHYTDGQRDCGFKYALTKMWVTLPDGSQQELRDVNTQGAPSLTTDLTNGYHYLKDRDRGRVWRSIDGSNIIFVRDPGYPVGQIGGANEFPSGWVFQPDGTRLRMVQGVCSTITDRNGNFITLGSTYTDQLGRQTIISATPSTWTITVKGYLGTPDRSLTLDFGTIGDLANLRSDFHALPRPFTTGDAFRDAQDNYSYHTIQTAHTDLFIESEGMIHNYGSTDGFDVGTRTALTRLNLLDGRSLRFRYNQYGEVAEIVYPGGGISRIDYTGLGSGNCEIQAPFNVNRVVGERRTLTIDENNVEHVEATWLYSPDAEWIDGVYRPAAVVEAHQGGATGTLLARERHFFKMLNAEYRPCGGPYTLTGNEKWENAKEFRTETYNGTGTTVTVRDWQQRAAVTWANDVNLGYNSYVNEQYHGQEQPPNDPRVMWEETTLEDGKVQRVEYGYDQFNNVISIKEYDLGTASNPGTLLRQTFRKYGENLGGNYGISINGYCYSNLNPTDSSCGSGLASDVTSIIYQPGLLLSETIKDGSNGSVGVQKSFTQLEYDAYSGTDHAPIVSNSGMIQYDGSRFINLPSATEPRGNVTKVTRWLSGGTDVVAFSQYDNAGQVIWSKDPNGNISTVAYADNFGAGDNPDSGAAGPNGATYAFASVATNALNHVAKMQYNYSLGAATGAKDANNVITKTEYDNLGRPFKVTAALGLAEQSVSQMSYPTLQENSAKVSKQLDATRWLTSKTDFDGFDRPWLTSGAEDGLYYNNANYTIFSKTVYDALGRVKLVTNPYRAAAAGTDSWSRSSYDLGGRLTEVATFAGGVASQPPDTGTNANWTGSVTTLYASEVTTVTDQAGRKRRSVTDGLGRLVRVDEPDQYNNLDVNGAPFQSTSYGYDTLDNLTSVSQGAQTRTFAYDSLKRLTSAINPESGMICYGTVTTVGQCPVNGYDPNGNLIYKTDARGVLSTYGYDALNRNTSVTYTNDPVNTPTITRTYDGATNGKGKLWKTETAGANGSLTTISSYDALGRPTSQSQQFHDQFYVGGWSGEFMMSATYDKSGHALTKTYPSGHEVSYAYDDAGRTETFAGNLGNGSDITYASGMIYSASGALAKEEFGTDTPIFNKLLYNVRGQLAEIRESTTSATDTSFDRGAIINHYSNNYGCWGASCTAPDNNGNLMKQEIYIKDAQGSDTMSWQQYEYDSLNRLGWVREISNSAEIWRQTFAYDRYGNRTIDQGVLETYGTGINKKNFTVNVTNKNRLGVPSGQTGAMEYDDAGNLTNDTYTGAGGRTYDAENRMIAASDNSEQTSTYVYDGDGRRVRRLSGEESWQVYGIEGQLVAEYEAYTEASSAKTEYGYRNGSLLIIANNSPTPFCQPDVPCPPGLPALQWLVSDQLGTPRMLFDQEGNVSRHDYLPFGEELFAGTGGRTTTMGYDAEDGVRQRFTSKERDNETGLDYSLARYYSAMQGRFTSVDPLIESAKPSQPQGWNRYSYTINNPLKYIDPSGLIWGTYTDNLGKEHYQWYKDQDTMESSGATAVNVSSGHFIYEAANGQFVRLDAAGPHPEASDAARRQGWDAYDSFGGALEHQHGERGDTSTVADQAFGLALSDTGGRIAVDIGARLLSRVLARTALDLAGSAEMQVVRTIGQGEKIADIVNEAKAFTFQSGNEHALVTLANGERALVSGGQLNINFAEGQVTRLFGHTHSYNFPASGASAADRAAIRALGQRSSWIMERGHLFKFGR